MNTSTNGKEKNILALKCTQKLMKAFGKSAGKLFPAGGAGVLDSSSILGPWSAHLVIYLRKRYVLFVNDKTLLSILIPYVPKETLVIRFQEALLKELIRLGVPADSASEEAWKFHDFVLEKNSDRSMAGYMKQKAFEYKVIFDNQLERKGALQIERAQALINKSPQLKREKVYPCFYVRELFGIPDDGSAKWKDL